MVHVERCGPCWLNEGDGSILTLWRVCRCVDEVPFDFIFYVKFINRVLCRCCAFSAQHSLDYARIKTSFERNGLLLWGSHRRRSFIAFFLRLSSVMVVRSSACFLLTALILFRMPDMRPRQTLSYNHNMMSPYRKAISLKTLLFMTHSCFQVVFR
jgi:hypothetical protein